MDDAVTVDVDDGTISRESENVKNLRGHWVRVSFQAKIRDNLTYNDVKGYFVEIKHDEKDESYKTSDEDEDRAAPNVGNEPIVSNEDHTGIINLTNYSIGVGNEARYSDTSNTVTVKPDKPVEEPEIEKYVNKDVHQSLVEFDRAFTYDIMAYITKDADKAVITDTLVNALEFSTTGEGKGAAYDKDKNAITDVVARIVAKDTNDHTAGSTVADADEDNEGTDVSDKATVEINGKKLTVTFGGDTDDTKITDADGLRGKWVQITFYAKYTDETIEAVEVRNTKAVRNNGAVISAKYPTVAESAENPAHEGTYNKAEYEIFVNNVSEYTSESNTVTVDAETTKIPVKKQWQNADGTTADWPDVTTQDDQGADVTAPAEVEVKVMNGTDVVDMIKLTKDKPEGESKELPKLIDVTYTLDEETQVPGWYTTVDNDNHVITNKAGEKPEVEKYVNNDVTYDFDNFDQVFEYEIMGYVPTDASEITFIDKLVEYLEYAPGLNLGMYDMGTQNNHINTVALDGTIIEPEKYSVNADYAETNELKVTVTGENVEPLRGHWVKLTFEAQIRKDYYDEVLAKIKEKASSDTEKASDEEDKWENFSADDNAPVLIKKEHDGVPNTAGFLVKVDHGGTFESETNTVTVEPKTTELTVDKKWVNADGSDSWPEDVTVEVTLKAMKGEDTVDISGFVTETETKKTLSATAPTAEWKDLPKLEGVVYDAEEDVKVPNNVEKAYEQTGKLTEETKITFTNKEEEPAFATIEAEKTVYNVTTKTDITDKAGYTFVLTALEDAPMPAEKTSPLEVTTGADGKVSFGEIEYKEATTYEYTITEKIPADVDKKPGMTYDATVINVTVVVDEDPNDSTKLAATVSYERADDADTTADEANKAVLVNKITEEGPTAHFEANKVLLDADKKVKVNAVKAGDFTFKLEAVTRNAPMPEEDTADIDAEGKAVFRDIAFPTTVASYTYKIFEVIPEGEDRVSGLEYDETQVTAIVHVERAEDGTWSADVEYLRNDDADTADDESDKATFVNKELAPGTTTAELETKKTVYDTVTKQIETIEANTFSFKIEAVTANAPMPQNTIVYNEADGTAKFGSAVYTEPGTYEYKITEIIPASKLEGVTYDETEIKAVVTVTVDETDATELKAEVEYKRADDPDTAADIRNEENTSVFVNKKAGTEIEVTKFWAGGESDKATEDNLISWLKLMRRVAENDTSAWESFAATPSVAIGTDGWKITFDNLPLYVVNSINKYMYSVVEELPVNEDGTRDFSVIYSNDDRALADGSITNEAPEIEKYVNKDVHADIVEFDKEFTYDIMAYVTNDADTIKITDELVNALEFADTQGNKTTKVSESVSAVKVKSTSDHTANSSVSTAGTDVEATAVIDGQKLTVTIDNTDNSQSLRGKWVQVTFNARIKDSFRSIDALKASNTGDAADWSNITDNGIVISENEAHEGVTNKASYTISVGNEARYKDDSNTVTIKPETEELKVEKKWQDENGKALAWPEGVEVEVKLLAVDAQDNDRTAETGLAEADITKVLDKDHRSYTWTELPRLKGVTYSVEEESIIVDPVTNKPYMADYTTSEDGTIVITNKPEQPEVEKYVNKDVNWDFENFDQTFTYDIMAFVTNDADKLTITDELNELLIFADPVNLTVKDMGIHNDHATTVRADGIMDITGQAATATAENGKVNVVVDGLEAKGLRGHWVKVSFDAVINPDKYAEVAKLITEDRTGANWAEIKADENGNVNIKKAHDGIRNQARYTLETANGGRHELETNVVTVEPETTKVEVSKEWLLDGNTAEWPEGATVEVKLLAVDAQDNDCTAETGLAEADITKVLDKDNRSYTWTELPKLEGVTYGVAEGTVTNAGDYEIGEVEKVSDGVYKITNEATTKYTDVKVSKEWIFDGETAAWPEGATVEVKLIKTTEVEDAEPSIETVRTETLTAAQPEFTFTDLAGGEGISYTVEEGEVENAGEYELGAVEETETGVFKITNRLEKPEVEKYVNKDVTWDFENFDQVFTYDVLAYITSDADTLTVTDTLNGLLEFADPANLAVTDLGVHNDHKSTVKTDGVAVDAKTLEAKDGKVTVVVEGLEAKGLRGHWLRVSFDAKIKESAYETVADLVENRTEGENWNKITDNGTVEIDTEHDGIPNKASCKITTDNEGTYELDTNTVTIEPKTTEVQVRKEWKNADGTDMAWPAGVIATVKLLKNGVPTGDEKELENSDVAKFTKLPKLDEVVYSVEETALTVDGKPYMADQKTVNGVVIITNKPEQPEIEKYVNKDVTWDFENFDQVFTYDVMGYITEDADFVTFTDELNSLLEFAGENANLKVTDMGTSNDHKTSVRVDGTAVEAKTLEAKYGKVTVVVEGLEAKGLRGHWLKVSFDAKIKESVYGTVADLIKNREEGDNWKDIADNGLVDIETKHDGIPNKAGYVITTDNGGTHELDSNTVTVEPETTEVKVSKEWLLDEEVVNWPAGATVEVKLTQTKDGQTTEVAGKTDRLASNKPTVTFTDLPKLEGVTYGVAEGTVKNGGDYKIGDVEEVETGVFKITNKATIHTPHLEKYINEDVDAHLVEFDRVFRYDILGFVTDDAERIVITDELVPSLEFADGTVSSELAAVKTSDSAKAVTAVVKKAVNNHAAYGTVSEEGEEVGYEATIEDNVLTVTVDNAEAQDIRGQWVQVTFYAKYTDDAVKAAKVADSKEITDNGSVISGIRKHDGTANTASYEIFVGNESKYSAESNTVTHDAETTTVEAEKQWKNADESSTWPEGVEEVKVNVMNGDKVADTITLTADTPKAASKELPKLIGVEYTIAEDTEVPGYTSAVDGNVVINTWSEGTKVTISKTDLGGVEIEGAHIKVTKSDGTFTKEWDSTKEAEILELEDGTYTLEEVVAPEGYKQVTTKIVFTVENNSVTLLTTEVNNGGKITVTDKHIVLEDAPNKVTISKKEVGGGPELEGAKLIVKVKDSDNIVEEWTSGKEAKVIEKLPAGEYTLTEITAPDGYEVAETITFRIDEEGNVEVLQGENWVDAAEHIVMFDAPKAPAPASAVIEATKILEGGELKEGQFEFTLEGADDYKQTKTNAVDGKVTFDAIEYTSAGKYFYTIKETVKADDNSIIYDTAVRSVTVNVTENKEARKFEAAVSYGAAGSAAFTNKTIVPGTASANIKGTKSVTVNGTTDNSKLSAGEFEFTISENGTVLDTVSNDAEGNIDFGTFTYTEAGTHVYTIAEVPGNEAGVTYDNTVYTVTVAVNDVTADPAAPAYEAQVIYPEGFESGVRFTNNKEDKKEINISKVDITTGNELPGAILTVKDAAGNVVENGTWTSTSEVHKISLAPGSYTLIEDQWPLGYNKAEDISFVVNEDGSVTVIGSGKVGEDGKTVIMEDSSNTVREMFNLAVSIEKKWTDLDGKDADWPEGASVEFTLEYYDNKTRSWTTYAPPFGTPVKVTLTPDQPIAVFEELPAKIDGNDALYRAVETKIEGYAQATSTVADPKAYEGVMTAVNVPEVPEEFEVYISKNSLGGPEIPGAHIVIYGADGGIVDEWDSTTKPHSVTLKPGSYTLRETVAPEGYQKVETAVTFVVDATGHVILGTTTVDHGGKISVQDANHLILEDAPVNEVEKHEVKISKTDLGGTELEGAHIVLKDDKGNVITEWDSTKDAYTLMLPAGTYVMVETVAPEGYERVTTEMTFTVGEDGKVTLITTTVDNGGRIKVLDGNHIVLEDAPTTTPTIEKEKDTTETPKTTPTEKRETPSVPTTARRVVTPSSPTVSRATSTGDSNSTTLWIVLATIAAAAMIAGAAVMVRRRREDD